MSDAVFADTFYWIALTTPDDASHAPAVAFDAALRRPSIITTEEVLTEVLTFLGGKGPFLRMKAVAITRGILADKASECFRRAMRHSLPDFDLYSQRPG